MAEVHRSRSAASSLVRTTSAPLGASCRDAAPLGTERRHRRRRRTRRHRARHQRRAARRLALRRRAGAGWKGADAACPATARRPCRRRSTTARTPRPGAASPSSSGSAPPGGARSSRAGKVVYACLVADPSRAAADPSGAIPALAGPPHLGTVVWRDVPVGIYLRLQPAQRRHRARARARRALDRPSQPSAGRTPTGLLELAQMLRSRRSRASGRARESRVPPPAAPRRSDLSAPADVTSIWPSQAFVDHLEEAERFL